MKRKTMSEIRAEALKKAKVPNKRVASNQITPKKIVASDSPKPQTPSHLPQQVELIDNYYHWTTGTKVYLGSSFFHTGEFDCPMAINQKISKDLVDKLILIRSEHGSPITITSAFRSKLYQDDLTKRGYKTAKKSQHLLGNAVDITARDMKKLLRVAEPYFEAIGIAQSFLHLDLRTDKIRRWTY